MALEIILKSFLQSSQFNDSPDKDWAAISRLVPGTTPKQCQKRYEELLQQHLSQTSLSIVGGVRSTDSSSTRVAGRNDPDQVDQKNLRPASAKRGGKTDKDSGSAGKSDSKRPNSAEQSPIMVVHVCDEAKHLKQDFHCPRDLLISEMRYFAEYLSTDAQRWEDVDISVHCDVQIFDWLMRYVKRHSRDVPVPPKLEPSNVISILISSDFLKMDSLVGVCVEYCHDNMNAIIATPCNMNCINDKLIASIAELFTHNEADEIRDRKDKFKSKLFAKKIEKLFDPEHSSSDSPENAVTLFRCCFCKKLLTKNLESKLKCLQSRMTIDSHGNLVYSHMRDLTWDVNDYLVDLKGVLKTWRDVYWRVWGIVSYLECSRCKETFSCAELGHCRYHPEQAEFEAVTPGAAVSIIGTYSCCGQKTLRFDPTSPNLGCKVRDHVVNLEGQSDEPNKLETNDPPLISNAIYDDLLAHREAVCVPFQKSLVHDDDVELNVFIRDETVSKSKGTAGSGVPGTKTSKSDSSLSDEGAQNSQPSRPQPRLQALTVEREVSYEDDVGVGESEDEVGDEEEGKEIHLRLPPLVGDYQQEQEEFTPASTQFTILKSIARRPKPIRRSRVTVDPRAILLDAPDFSTVKNRKWDSSRSMRWNQDGQREEDQRRMNEIVTYLTRLRLNTDKLDKLKQREYAGGTFAKLESQWKSVYMPPPKAVGPLARTKTRLTNMKMS